MLESIRRHRRILQFVLLILIVPSFVIVGAWDLVSPQPGAGTLAVVDGRKITTPEWQESHRRSIEALSSQLGGQIPFSAFDTPASRVESLDTLIGQQVTAAAARSAFLSIPDAQIAEMIAQVPQFQSDGKFSLEQAKQFLAARGMTSSGFEAGLRFDLLSEKYPSGIGQTEIGSRRLARRLAQSETEQREIWALRITTQSLAATSQPTASEVQSYYEARQSEYRTEELVDISLVMLSQADGERAEVFANLVYEQSDSLDPAAQKLGLRVLTFTGVGRSGPYSPASGPLPSPEAALALNHGPLRQALFSTDVLVDGRNTESIEVRPGLLVSARVAQHHPPKPLSLDQVRPQIVAELTRLKAAQAARDQADQLAKRVDEALGLGQGGTGVAADSGARQARLQSLGLRRMEIARDNLVALGSVLNLTTPASQRDLARQVFSSSLTKGRATVVDLGPAEGSLAFVWTSATLASDDSPRARARLGELYSGLERVSAETSWANWMRVQEKRFSVERYPEKLSAADS
ncbi:MAG: hypothetical protein RLZZ344_1436 [Pseudomonadota bacterium]|jgi:hypothetical protein